MPAAGWAAESGDPVLFVNPSGVPEATRQALLSHQQPHIYVLGPAERDPRLVAHAARQVRHGQAGRRAPIPPPTRSPSPTYRDPAVRVRAAVRARARQLRLGDAQPGPRLRAAQRHAPARRRGRGAAVRQRRLRPAAAGRQCLYAFPSPVLNYFLNYATPGYTQEGPTAAVYNHGWVIGDQSAISVPVQARDGQPARGRPADAMSQAEHPDRLRAEPRGHRRRRAPADGRLDAALRASAARADPRLIRGLPADHPARVEGEREIARLDRIAFDGRDARPPGRARADAAAERRAATHDA